MKGQKRHWRHWLEAAWHGIIGNIAYDILKLLLTLIVALLSLVLVPFIQLVQGMLGVVIPAMQGILSTEVMLTVGTISSVVVSFSLGLIFAGIIGTILNQILWRRGRVTAIRRPQPIDTAALELLWKDEMSWTVQTTDLRRRTRELLERVQLRRESAIVQSYGTPRAVIIPYEEFESYVKWRIVNEKRKAKQAELQRIEAEPDTHASLPENKALDE